MKINLYKIKEDLEAELATLTKELQDLGIQNPAAGDDWIPVPEKIPASEADQNVVADRSEDWNERRGTLDVLETRYNNIHRALQKLETGKFGICEIGNEPIEVDRLTANPTARTCKNHMGEDGSLPR